MDMLTTLWVTAGGIVVGVLTGVTGMGGILIPPFMIALLGMDTHVAMGTSLASFLPSCLLGVWMHHRQGNIVWSLAGPLSAAGLICVFIGTELKAYSPGSALNILLALLIIVVGGLAFRPVSGNKNPAKAGPGNRSGRSSFKLAALGGGVGTISGLTGAGGSVLAVPAMITMGYPPLTAIATSLVYVVVISATGTVGNALHNAVDFSMAGLCAAGQVIGILVGFRVARYLNAAVLRLLVAWVCVLTGIGILIKTVCA